LVEDGTVFLLFNRGGLEFIGERYLVFRHEHFVLAFNVGMFEVGRLLDDALVVYLLNYLLI